MKVYQIAGGELRAWLQAIIDSGRRVLAPVVDGGGRADFAVLSSAADVADDTVVQTTQSPKRAAFPRVDTLFEYTKDGGNVELRQPAAEDYPDTVVWRCRPCDVAGFAPLSAIMNWDYKDSLYNARLARTTLVAFACTTADDYCFCTSTGGAPDRADGCDVLITPVGDSKYIVEVLTEKGEALMAVYSGDAFKTLQPNEALKAKEEAVVKLPAQFTVEEIRAKFSAEFFDSPVWQAQSARCLGCGACAYVCPTCACFDIQEDTHGKHGSRLRCWDSCGLGLFTKHTSGHNPRPSQATRWRQRLMHKFAYIPERLNALGCTGCGRCGRGCPVDMNLAEHLKMIVNCQ